MITRHESLKQCEMQRYVHFMYAGTIWLEISARRAEQGLGATAGWLGAYMLPIGDMIVVGTFLPLFWYWGSLQGAGRPPISWCIPPPPPCVQYLLAAVDNKRPVICEIVVLSGRCEILVKISETAHFCFKFGPFPSVFTLGSNLLESAFLTYFRPGLRISLA